MTIEQRPELSRLINPSIAASWKHRWSVLRSILPFVLIMATLCGEAGLFGAWLTNQPAVFVVALAIGLFYVPAMLLCVVILCLILWAIWTIVELFQRGKTRAIPTIVFNDDEILYGRYEVSLKWAAIDNFHFEPVTNAPGMTQLSLWRTSSRSGRKYAFYGIVIENQAQVHELIDYLHRRREQGLYIYAIVLLDQPLPLSNPPPPSFLSGFAEWASVVASMNGLVILFLAFDQFELEKLAKYRRLIAHVASSPTEFHLYCFNVGVLLLVAGVWQLIRQKREEKRLRALPD